MANTSPTFGALVVASLAGVVGTKYLGGATVAMLDGSFISSVVVADSVVRSVGCGLLLCAVAVLLAKAVRGGRFVGIVTFLLVAGLSLEALRAMDPIIVTETVGMGLATFHLLVRRPIETEAGTAIDTEDSATRVGSTLR